MIKQKELDWIGLNEIKPTYAPVKIMRGGGGGVEGVRKIIEHMGCTLQTTTPKNSCVQTEILEKLWDEDNS